MSWNVLSTAVEKALHYSTPLGTIWMFLLFTFRMFITSVVGSAVYGDESVSFFRIFSIENYSIISREISNVIQTNLVVKMCVSIDFRRYLI